MLRICPLCPLYSLFPPWLAIALATAAVAKNTFNPAKPEVLNIIF